MLKRIEKVFLTFLCGSFVFINIGCSSSNASEDRLKFYYYPDKNVYYDVSRSNYLYSLNGGKSWDSLLLSNSEEAEALGKREVIFNETPDVWRKNAAHLQQYGGTNLAIAGYGMGQELSAEDVVSEKKVVRKAATEVRSNRVKKEKKGLGRFIDNIFGKKKK